MRSAPTTASSQHLEDLGLSREDAQRLLEAVSETRVYDREDLRTTDALEDLRELVDDLGVDVDLDASEDSSPSEDDRRDREDSPEWAAFSELTMDGETLGFALDDGAVDGDDVRIRIDPYPRIAD